jgi:acyl carrier protein
MSDSDIRSKQQMHEEVGSWLVERIADYARRPVKEIDINTSVAEAGLDSVYWFLLCGEIEDRFLLSVEPALVLELDTLAALAAHLSEKIVVSDERASK